MNTGRIQEDGRTIGYGIWPLSLIAVLVVIFHYFREHYLFYIAVEMLTTVVSFGMFIISINTYRISRSHFFVFLGLAFGFVGLLDLLHALAGYGFEEHRLQLASFDESLWLAPRLLESISLVAAFYFIKRDVRLKTVFLVYSLILTLLAAFFFHADQALIREFAEANVYLLGTAVLLLYRNRNQVAGVVFRFMFLALLSAIGCELIQINTTVEANAFMVAHVLNYLSFYFMYKALVEATLQAPYQTIFHDLNVSERKYRTVVNSLPDFLFRMLADGTIVEIIPTREFAVRMLPGDESKNIRDILPDDIAAMYMAKAREVLADKEIKVLEYRLPVDGVLYDREARLFSSGDREVLVLIRDVTEKHRREEALRRDLLLAAEVQRSFLPPPAAADGVRIETIFEPVHMVSGDLYGYKWRRNGRTLSGFVFDIMGHGLATTLKTSALMILFSQAFESDMSLQEKMAWVNAEAMRRFNDESFAAAFCFEIDFEAMTLTYVAGGITHFLASLGGVPEEIVCEGSLVGVDKDAVYEEKTIRVAPGDKFYFITDGFMQPGVNPVLANFGAAVAWLRRLATAEGRRDDCSALCIALRKPSIRRSY